MRYRELEQCRDFDRLKAVFVDEMLRHFEKQLDRYINGSEERPEIASWWEGAMSTDEFIDMCL